MNLLSILIGPITEILAKAIPDASKRDEAKAAIEQAIVSSNDKALESMATTMAADSASEGWLTRNARPMVVFWSLGMISYVAISKDFTVLDTLSKIPPQMWELVTLGTGMYIASRGIEKAVSTVVKGIRK